MCTTLVYLISRRMFPLTWFLYFISTNSVRWRIKYKPDVSPRTSRPSYIWSTSHKPIMSIYPQHESFQVPPQGDLTSAHVNEQSLDEHQGFWTVHQLVQYHPPQFQWVDMAKNTYKTTKKTGQSGQDIFKHSTKENTERNLPCIDLPVATMDRINVPLRSN